MARKRGDWVPCDNYGGVFETGVGVPENIVLVAPRDSQASPGEVGVVEVQDEILTSRVVGSVEHEVAGAQPVQIVERIRVGLLPDDGLSAAFYADNFRVDTEANEPFLWQRVSVMEPGDVNTNIIMHPFWSVVDVRVSRRLDRSQALFYSVQVFSGALRTRVYLRTWARAV